MMDTRNIKCWIIGVPLLALLMTLSTKSLAQGQEQNQDSVAFAPKDSTEIADFFNSYAVQDTISEDTIELEYIALKHKQYTDSIVIRWAPTTRKLLVKGNKIGYVVKRYGYPPDNVLDTLSDDEQEMIISDLASLSNPVKAYDSTKWASIFPTNDKYAIIAAGATVGALDVDENEVGFGVKSQQDESIFGFTLMSADLSATAANGLGLRFVDTEIEKGRTYEYRVSLADPVEVAKMDSLMNLSYDDLDSAQVITWINWLDEQADGLVRFEGIQEPMLVEEFRTISQENAVQLRWPLQGNEKYTAFFIERSSDGGQTFDTLTYNAYVSEPSVVEDSIIGAKSFYKYVDQLDENYKEYTYRIFGLDGFADKSEPATAKGMGLDLTPPENPQLLSGEYQENQKNITLIWRSIEIPDDFSKLFLQHRMSSNESWNTIDESLTIDDTVYTYEPDAHQYTNYFRLGAADTVGNTSHSFEVFVNIPDTIPPPAPYSLNANIDTTGTVKISWKSDIPEGERLLGFRVYYGNKPSHEFTQVTSKPVGSNVYEYTIPIKTLTEKIYYKVQAVDNSYNHSKFSPTIEVQKPDVIPPVAPVFRSPKISEEQVVLTWAPSSSRDLTGYLLTKTKEDGDPQTILIEDVKATSYTDKDLEKGIKYYYTIVAFDDAKLQSKDPYELQVKLVDKKRLASISNLKTKYNKNQGTITLTWDSSENASDIKYVIYRNLDNEKLKRYRLADETRYVDEVNTSGTYYYGIRVVSKDGSKSVLSPPESVRVNR